MESMDNHPVFLTQWESKRHSRDSSRWHQDDSTSSHLVDSLVQSLPARALAPLHGADTVPERLAVPAWLKPLGAIWCYHIQFTAARCCKNQNKTSAMTSAMFQSAKKNSGWFGHHSPSLIAAPAGIAEQTISSTTLKSQQLLLVWPQLERVICAKCTTYQVTPYDSLDIQKCNHRS